MQNSYITNRLSLTKLNLNDAEFIFELVNTPEWIQFIGDRNIKSKQDATEYVRKIIENSNVHYWVVTIKEHKLPIGIITFIKRDYLEHHDIGFAFLSQHGKQGYAYEATSVILNDVITDKAHSHIFATTVKENTNSIHLLEKLGLRFNKEILVKNEMLLVYTVASDKLSIDHLTKQFFSVFNNTNKQQQDWSIIHNICLSETLIIKKNGSTEELYNLHTFIVPRKKILSNGTLTEFEENETMEETNIAGNIAQRFSKYQKSGYVNGNYFKEYGTKFFQFIRTNHGWKINALIWEDYNS